MVAKGINQLYFASWKLPNFDSSKVMPLFHSFLKGIILLHVAFMKPEADLQFSITSDFVNKLDQGNRLVKYITAGPAVCLSIHTIWPFYTNAYIGEQSSRIISTVDHKKCQNINAERENV